MLSLHLDNLIEDLGGRSSVHLVIHRKSVAIGIRQNVGSLNSSSARPAHNKSSFVENDKNIVSFMISSKKNKPQQTSSTWLVIIHEMLLSTSIRNHCIVMY